MSKNKINALTKKIINASIDESLVASMEVQDLINEKEDNKKLLGPILIDNLKNEKEISKLRRIIWAISVFEIEEAKSLLRKFINHEDHFIREEAILTLGILKDKEVINDLIKIINTKDDLAREEAAIALGLMGVKDALKPLIAQLDDPDINIVIASCLALSYLRDPEAIKPLITKMIDDNKYIRRYSAKAVYTFGRIALNELRDALKEVPILKRKYLNKLIKEIDKSDLTEVHQTYGKISITQ
ncbi:MAG: HEAT repeat domain-containing protein [Candidatus Helarchaeota archaeon]